MKSVVKKLLRIKKKQSGRDNSGTISIRHRGVEQKRYIRTLDMARDKINMKAEVVSIDYDPGRTGLLALLKYEDGQRRYILATSNMKIGDKVVSSENAPIKDGNTLPLKNIPLGLPIHALELIPGRGGKIVKSAGSAAYLQSIDGAIATVKMPSGEIRIFNSNCLATIGQVSNADHMNQKLTKAGQVRHKGIRPTVRGVAQHPDSHPHGGGEGRSSIGMNPKTPWGRPAYGKRTRKKNNRSNSLIVSRRRK